MESAPICRDSRAAITQASSGISAGAKTISSFHSARIFLFIKHPSRIILCREGCSVFFFLFADRQQQHEPLQRRVLAHRAALDVIIRLHAEINRLAKRLR